MIGTRYEYTPTILRPILVSYPGDSVMPSSAGRGKVPGSWNTMRIPYPEAKFLMYSSISKFSVSFIPGRIKKKI